MLLRQNRRSRQSELRAACTSRKINVFSSLHGTLVLLCATLMLSACDDDNVNSESYQSQGMSGDTAGESVQNTAGSSSGGDELSQQMTGEELTAGTDDIWATKPPAGAEAGEEQTSGEEVEAMWVNVGLEGLGLISPSDGEDDTLPTGDSICAYQVPVFTLEHPLASIDRGSAESEWTWHGDVEARYDLAPAPVAHLSRERHTRLDEAINWVEGQLNSQATHKLEGVVLPTHVNDLPLYERAQAWSESRCYELGPFDTSTGEALRGGTLLSEEDAYHMYTRLVRTSLWRAIDQSANKRTIIGLRGAYPGSLRWHHNAPNQYNDAIVLLWRDESGTPHVREYPVNTDTGVYDFGVDNSSSLRANRHYPYVNGWHRDYNAIQIALPAYPVRDDTNNNGHWDSDRNGWLDGPEPGEDYDRLGTAHNIHAGDSDGPLGDALINIASAGCQVIPGMQNWLSFISEAWTGLGDEVDYYLIDARDISPRFWSACDSADGSHDCPYLVERFPYTHTGDTRLSSERRYHTYNCSDANESGPELVYVINLPQSGRLRASVTTESDDVDPDLYLLEGDDFSACKTRDHRQVNAWLPPGRYVLIVDTWVNAAGQELSGEFELTVDWSPED